MKNDLKITMKEGINKELWEESRGKRREGGGKERERERGRAGGTGRQTEGEDGEEKINDRPENLRKQKCFIRVTKLFAILYVIFSLLFLY